ncbi:hypothetical protein OUZ56_032529 [Daphnia magna]|uniref:Uncharacterized protein n=1 Tax=Daphnia magna TaxID=35525 RepID=A0ABR0B969_9CRUS|nr:hypothetical protein OUZ56_032529 [Daphnia magna]
MRAIAAVSVGLFLFASSSSAFAQEASEEASPETVDPQQRPSIFLGAELERPVYTQYGSWKPTSLGVRLGLLVPASRRIAILGSFGLRTPILDSTFYDASSMGGGEVRTEHLTIPIDLGVRVTPVPGPVAGYVDGGLRVLLRKTTSSLYDDKSTTEKWWEVPHYGLSAGGGIRADRWEVGLHGTFLMFRMVDFVKLGLGIRAARVPRDGVWRFAGGLTIIDAEPPKDAGSEVRPPPVDAGPKLGAFCLPNAAPIVLPQPVPSLAETPRFLWAKTITQGITADPQGLTLSGDRLAMTGLRDIWILDFDGNVIRQVGDRTSLGITTAIGDGRGNFFYSANSVVSLDRDGNMRWEFRFGPARVQTEFGYTRGLVVSPDGGVYFGASDLQIHALAAADGRVLWERPYTGTNSGTQVGPAVVAVGDAVFVDWVAYDRQTGTPLGVLPYQGYPAGFTRFNSRYEANVYQLPRTTGVVDRCGREVLQRDESPQWRFTYGFEDETIVNDFSVKDPSRPGLRSAFVEGADRRPLTPPQDVDWAPFSSAPMASPTGSKGTRPRHASSRSRVTCMCFTESRFPCLSPLMPCSSTMAGSTLTHLTN